MKYTDSHEWIRIKGAFGIVGISEHAQKELGEIVYVELPEIGQEVKAGHEIAILESTKAAADIYAPISGRIVKINEALKEDISSLNQAPETSGWLFEIEIRNGSELEQLLDQAAYHALVK